MTLPPDKSPEQPNALIVAFLGVNVKIYQAFFLQFLDRLTFRCPKCQGDCHRHGWRERHVYGGFERVVVRVLRVKCLQCGRVHEVLPDFLRPHGRYGQFVREPAVNAVRSGEAAEQVARRMGLVPETVRRWVHDLAERFEQAKAAIRSLLAQLRQAVSLHDPDDSLKRVCDEVTRTLARSPASSSLFGLANILLSNLGFPLWL